MRIDSPTLRFLRTSAMCVALAACATPGQAQVSAQAPAGATYADLASLVEAAPVVARVQVRDQAALKPVRAPGVAPGDVRLYLETRTEAALKAPAALGETFAYLVDVPADAKGKAPKLKKQSVLVFARPVPGNPGQLQLVEPDAQIAADPQTEGRVRAIIAEFAKADAPPRITGVRDAMSVAGNLAGESETQLFLDTADGTPVSLTVLRRPGMPPSWGVAWTELVDQAARPPEPGTLAWYRLACSLPAELPRRAFLQREAAAQAQARADYALVLEQLGPCERTRQPD